MACCKTKYYFCHQCVKETYPDVVGQRWWYSFSWLFIEHEDSVGLSVCKVHIPLLNGVFMGAWNHSEWNHVERFFSTKLESLRMERLKREGLGWRLFTLTAVALRFCRATAVKGKNRHLVAEINVGQQQRA
jgi:hypothetical protein